MEISNLAILYSIFFFAADGSFANGLALCSMNKILEK